MLNWLKRKPDRSVSRPSAGIDIRVVGVGGGGGNAVRRMAESGIDGVRYLVLNTDIQAMKGHREIQSFAIGPDTTSGMGSGGRTEVGRKAMRESAQQVSRLLDGAEMVFVAAGMGGGTGTGAAPLVAELAGRAGALTVGVVTLPFSFEGPRRRSSAEHGLRILGKKVDTLITVENDRLLPARHRRVTLDRAFRSADEVLSQGVQGISDMVTTDGLINVDFADVKTIMAGKGSAFMAVGRGEGRNAASQAAKAALASPLFSAPLEGATGILFNVTGGPDLTLGQVHEVADLIRGAASTDANVIFGVVQDRQMKRRVSVTLVGTGLGPSTVSGPVEAVPEVPTIPQLGQHAPVQATNGASSMGLSQMRPML